MRKKVEIFVVDASLVIHQSLVSDKDWEIGFFSAQIGKINPISVMVYKRGWNKFTNCAGFTTTKEAEEFIDIIKEARKEMSPEEISERLQARLLGKCRNCLYENKAYHFSQNGHRCPVCEHGNVVYA